MCDCGEELDRRKRAGRRSGPGGGGGGYDSGYGGGASYAGGAGRGAGGNNGGRGGGKPGVGGRGGGRNGGDRDGGGGSDNMEYWTNIIGGTTMLLGLFTLLYNTFDLGTLWRHKLNGIWGGVLDSMCHNYIKDPCEGLRINSSRRKWIDGKQEEIPPGDQVPSPSEPCQATIIIELEDDD